MGTYGLENWGTSRLGKLGNYCVGKVGELVSRKNLGNKWVAKIWKPVVGKIGKLMGRE